MGAVWRRFLDARRGNGFSFGFERNSHRMGERLDDAYSSYSQYGMCPID